jgi:hypothetical protein
LLVLLGAHPTLNVSRIRVKINIIMLLLMIILIIIVIIIIYWINMFNIVTVTPLA